MKRALVVVPVLLAVAVFLLSGISVHAGDAAKININNASAEELTQLKGIGPSTAAKIIEYSNYSAGGQDSQRWIDWSAVCTRNR